MTWARGPDEIRPMKKGHLCIQGLLKLLGLCLGLVKKLVPVLARVPVAERIFRLADLHVGERPSFRLSVGLHAPHRVSALRSSLLPMTGGMQRVAL